MQHSAILKNKEFNVFNSFDIFDYFKGYFTESFRNFRPIIDNVWNDGIYSTKVFIQFSIYCQRIPYSVFSFIYLRSVEIIGCF